MKPQASPTGTPMRPGSFILVAGLGFTLVSSALAAPLDLEGTQGSRQPQVACDDHGVLHVVSAVGETIQYLQSKDDGKTFSKPATVAKLSNVMVGMRRGPRIAVSGGTILVTANSKDLWSFVSTDDGVSWSQAKRVNDRQESAREGLHNLVAIPGRGFFAVWLDDRNGKKEIWGASSADGTSWDANQQIYKSPDGTVCECCHPCAAASAKGELAVMWRNSLAGLRDMYWAKSDDGGKNFSKAEKLGTGAWKLNACPMDGGSIALDENGTPVTVWRREKTVYRSSSSRDETRLANGSQPVVVLSAGSPVFAWSADKSVHVMKKDSPATVLGGGNYVALASSPTTGTVFAIWEGDAGPSPMLRCSRIE